MSPDDFPFYAVSSVLGVFVTILLALMYKLLNKIEKLDSTISDFRVDFVRLSEQVKTLFNQNINFKQDIKNLQDEVEQIKLKQIGCGNCEITKREN